MIGNVISHQGQLFVVVQKNTVWVLAIELCSSRKNEADTTITKADLQSGDLPFYPAYVCAHQMQSLRAEHDSPVACLEKSATAALLKSSILQFTHTFSELTHQKNLPGVERSFRPGEEIPYAGRVFDSNEVVAAIDTTLDFWLTLGPEGAAFEQELAQYLGVSHSLLVNSGSSANLVAVATLTSHKIPANRRILPGDEVITCAAGFPTTVAPILQNGAVPVFIDNDPFTGNVKAEMLEDAYISGKTKAVMIAHTLGNPFDLGAVIGFCRKYDLWLIEDNCDALGCTYSMPLDLARTLHLNHLLKIAESNQHPLIRIEVSSSGLLLTAPTGTWGDISSQSFYPPHHLTMGEGGAVNIVSRPALKSYAESFRDWGRDCWCPSGKDNTCNKRYGWKLGNLPFGYDHKYIYSHLGYNLKPLDPQAAIGREQLRKLPGFVKSRAENWTRLREGLNGLSEYFEFALPTHATSWSLLGFNWDATGCRSFCSWFGFMLRVRPSSPFSHVELSRYLAENKIGSRMLFGGNLLRQPLFVELAKSRANAFRVIGDTAGADCLMNTALFLGTYPGLNKKMIDYEIDVIKMFIKQKAS